MSDFIIEDGVLTAYNGKDVNIVIPEGVTKIKADVFKETDIETIVLPESLEEITANSFLSCTQLKEIVIPDGVKSIKRSAFSRDEGIERIVIGNGVKEINQYAFGGCKGAKELVIGKSVEDIDWEAFVYCDKLESIVVDTENKFFNSRENCNAIIDSKSNEIRLACKNTTIPSGIKIFDFDILDVALKNVETLYIPASVTKIRGRLYDFIYKIKEIVVDPENKVYDSRDNCNAIIETATNTLMFGCKNTFIPPTITKIEGEAFMNADIEEIVIPDSVSIIGESAFEYCESLKSVILPNKLKKISRRTFVGCKELESIGPLNGVTEIERGAFWNCDKLPVLVMDEFDEKLMGDNEYDRFNIIFRHTKITEVRSIKTKERLAKSFIALDDVSVLDDAVHKSYVKYISGSVKKFRKFILSNENNILNSLKRGLISTTFANELLETIENGVIRAAVLEFINNTTSTKGTDFERELYKSQSLTEIKKNWSFEIVEGGVLITGYKGDEVKIEVPHQIGEDTVIAIGEYCFSPRAKRVRNKTERTRISQIIFPNSIKSIGDYAFYGCTNLDDVIIPEGVKSIGCCQFTDCERLKTIVLHDDITEIGDFAFAGCESLKNLDLPSNLSSLNDGVFKSCTGLTSIVIPDSVKSIGEETFDECTGLVDVTIGNGVKNIGEYAFNKCLSLKNLVFGESVEEIGTSAFDNCESIVKVVLPDSVRSVGSAFSWCNKLEELIIGSGLEELETGAFVHCPSLKLIKVDKRNPYYDSRNDCNAIIQTETNTLVLGNKNTIIPDSIQVIGDEAFWGCTGLEKVILHKNIKKVGSYAFMDCQNLTTITFCNGETRLEMGSLAIGHSVKILSPKDSYIERFVKANKIPYEPLEQ